VSDTKHTPGPWEYVPSTEHHGPYVTSEFGVTVCDCYVMSNPSAPSVLNGGDSYPVHHLSEMADPNARLIAAAPDLVEALAEARKGCKLLEDLTGCRGDDDYVSDLLAKIDAALSKALEPAGDA
jgi:hypothetical protein